MAVHIKLLVNIINPYLYQQKFTLATPKKEVTPKEKNCTEIFKNGQIKKVVKGSPLNQNNVQKLNICKRFQIKLSPKNNTGKTWINVKIKAPLELYHY